MMNNSKLTIQHFSHDKPFQGILISNSLENFCTVKLINKSSLICKKGDPIILGFFDNESKIQLVGGNVISSSVDSNQDNNYVIATDKLYFGSEKRQFERFPVSLYGNFKWGGLNRIIEVAIKDISCNGIKFYSKEEIEVGQILELNVYSNEHVKMFTSQVLRKIRYFDRYEYGLSLIHKDKSSIMSVESFINVLRSHQFNIIEKSL